MNELRIVLDLSDDTKALLSDLLGALKPISSAGPALTIVNAVEDPTPAVEEEVKPAKKTRKKAEPEPVTIAEPEPAPAAEPEVTPEPVVEQRKVELKDVQNAVTKACQAGKRDAAKAIVERYASKVSAIPEDKLAEVLEALEAL